MALVNRQFIKQVQTDKHGVCANLADWAVVREIELPAVLIEVQRLLASGTVDLVDVGMELFRLGYEVRRAQEDAGTRHQTETPSQRHERIERENRPGTQEGPDA